MSPYNYSVKINEHRARAVGLLMPISTKQSIEICKLIRRKSIQKAKKILNEAKDMKKPIPFTRFTEGAGHKHGIGPGKYPVKACNEILKLVDLVEANAQYKGLDTSSLEIIHICAKKGPKSWHYGRQSRIAMKRTHVEIVVEEKEIKKKEVKKETKKLAKKEESKPIKKQEEKKEPEKEIEEKPKEKVKEKQEKEIKEKEPEKSKEIKERAETKKEQPKEIEKPAEEKKEGKQEDKSQSKQEPKKVLKENKVPTATELAEKTKSKQEPKKVPAINELTKKKEGKVDKK